MSRKWINCAIRTVLAGLVPFAGLALWSAEKAVRISADTPLRIFYEDGFRLIRDDDGSEVGEWRGNVRLEHEDLRVRCDRLQAFKKDMEGRASGNVELIDQGGNITLTGENLLYRDRFEYIEMTGQPKMVQISADGTTTVATSDRMEFFQLEDRGRLVGNVEILQDKLRITCREAMYYNAEEKVVLSGEPVAQQQDSWLSGRKMIYHVNEGRMLVEGDVKGEVFPE